MPSYYHVNISPMPKGANFAERRREERELAAQARRELEILAKAKAGAPIDPAKGDVRDDEE